jgi:hypothetical protein
MVSEDYWDEDELQDRLYYARQRENTYHSPITFLNRLQRRFSRPRNFFTLLGFLFLFWWWSTSAERSTKARFKRFAYSQYTTDTQSLCNSLMVFESLEKLGSRAERVLLYPKIWLEATDDHINWQLLHKAESQFGVNLIPVNLLESDYNGAKPGTLDNPSADWDLSITKLRIFELHQYDRILHLDSDVTLLQHMDELFSMPKAPIAMPRAYWTDSPEPLWPYTSLIMLVEPDRRELPAMMEILRQWQAKADYSKSKKYDMDLLNHRFSLSTTTLPHRPYAMLSAEFRNRDHSAYLGTANEQKGETIEKWDPEKALKEAKLVHFSDWPLPKPWIMWPNDGLVEMQPDCGGDYTSECKEREIWKKLYEDFRKRRKKLCKISPVPAPNWKKWKADTGAG